MAMHTASVNTEHGRTLRAFATQGEAAEYIVDYVHDVYGWDGVKLMNETSDGRRGDVVDTIEGRRIGVYRIR